MALVEIKNYSFTYMSSGQQALQRIDLAVEPGQFVLLCGATGSGKSTLLRQLKPMAAPAGEHSGELRYQGELLEAVPAERQAQEIGLVMQEVDNQLVMEQVWQELAFPLENLGMERSEMQGRVAELASFFGLTPLLKRRLADLSGGQRQVINLASVLIMRPQLLLLDEPLAQLDPVMTKDFLQMLVTLHEELGMTIIIAEHHLEHLLPLVERVVVLEAGQIMVDGDGESACRYFQQRQALLEYVPQLVQLYWQVEGLQASEPPMTVRQGKHWASSHHWRGEPTQLAAKANQLLMEARDIYFRYERYGDDVLSALELALRRGEMIAVLGGNGSGKSTLLKVLLGALIPQRGSVCLKGRRLQKYSVAQLAHWIGYLPQNPEASFLCDSVAAELKRQRQQLGGRLDEAYFEQLIETFGLDQLLKQHPYDLSGGQKQRLALALAISGRPQLLLLDEPTRGLDPLGKGALARILRQLCQEGLAVIMVTHDLEFAAAHAAQCGLLFQGELSAVMPTGQFFAGKHFYTTTINKVFGQWLPQAVKASDIQVAGYV